MTHDELIAKAREHLHVLQGRSPSSTNIPFDRLSRVRVRDAAIVYFEGVEQNDRMEVVLDQHTANGWVLPTSRQQAQRRGINEDLVAEPLGAADAGLPVLFAILASAVPRR
jgi:hypothetical protein